MAKTQAKGSKSPKQNINRLHKAMNKGIKDCFGAMEDVIKLQDQQLKELQAQLKKLALEREKADAKIAALEQRPTVDDFVQELVAETKEIADNRRGDADIVRQVLRNLKKQGAARDLNVWMKEALKPATQVTFEKDSCRFEAGSTMNGDVVTE